ncbi:Tubulin--tyrosine ligase-like protein 12 [Rhizophlyctis rosea]|uniref:Tubulin--tyrosine ligase-like protein 12 n=1 Tax=Rhizophlyctis rosea TaxID=64517 RepID=A0AAD5SFN2_9FUNG|nr:Tubulin--tyrosine ligase-like protein 12 [Rhizophlyctis rosea]
MTTEEQFKAFEKNNRPQLAAVPKALWHQLHEKLRNEIFDAGSYFALTESPEPYRRYALQLQHEGGLRAQSSIFVVDHAWSFTPEQAKQSLREHPQLLKRLEELMVKPETEEPAPQEGAFEEIPEEWNDTVDIIVDQTGSSRGAAWNALEDADFQVVDAISRLTLEDDGTSDQMKSLQEAIAGQITKPTKETKQTTLGSRIDAVMNDLWSYSQTYEAAWQAPDGQVKNTTVSGKPRAGLEQNQSNPFMQEVGLSILHDDEPNVAILPFIYVTPESTTPVSVMWPIKHLAQGDLLKRDYVPAGVQGLDRMAYLNAFWKTGGEALKEFYERTVSAPPTVTPMALNSANVASSEMAGSLKLACNLLPSIVTQVKELANVELVGDAEASVVWERDPLKLTAVEVTKRIRESFGGAVHWFLPTFSITSELALICGVEYHHQINTPLHWTISTDPEAPPVVSANLSFLLRHRDLSMPGVAQRCIEKPVLYGNRKFALDYTVLVKSDGSGGYGLYLYKNFITRLARDEYDSKKLENAEVHYMIPRFDSSSKLSPDVATFVKNIEKSLSGVGWDKVYEETKRRIKDTFSGLLTTVEWSSKVWIAVYEVSVEYTAEGKAVIMDVQPDEHLVGVRAWDTDLSVIVGVLTGSGKSECERL